MYNSSMTNLRIVKIFLSGIVIFSIFILSWFIVSNLQSLKSKIVFGVVGILFAFLFLFKKQIGIFYNNFCDKILLDKKRTIFIIVVFLLLIGVIIRLMFYFMFDYLPISDPLSFFNQAKLIASGAGLVGNSYVGFFPYLAAYDNLLGLFIRIINNSWLATIVLNTLFDLASAIIFFVFIKNRFSIKLSIIALSLWIFNPFNIIFCALSLPVVVVNFFIIFSIYLFDKLHISITKNNIKHVIFLSIIFGLIVGLGNFFRPIFIVFIIAAFVFYIYLYLKNKNINICRVTLISFIIILSIFISMQKINTHFVSYQTGFNVSDNSGGWSIYVGSSSDGGGSWNEKDNKYLYDILQNNSDFVSVHNQLIKDGLKRYQDLGIFRSVKLIIKKYWHFAGNQNWLYDAEASIIGFSGSKFELVFGLYLLFYIFCLFIFSAYYLVNSLRSKINNQIIVYILILIIGLFLSSALVEVQIRYAQVLYPLFLIILLSGINYYIKDH